MRRTGECCVNVCVCCLNKKHKNTVLHPLLRLNQTYQKQLVENEGLQTEHSDIKSQLNSSKQEHKQMESDLSRLKDQNQQLDITTIKLSNQCEVHYQTKQDRNLCDIFPSVY